jgi:hypothetical protein
MSRVESILIVGGGTAGWLSAAYLNRALGDSVAITLVESPLTPRIGVGEATVPTLRNTLRFLGIEERDWMSRCNATFKLAVRFDDWTKPGSRDRHYYHPFFPRPEPIISPFAHPFFPAIGEGFLSAQYGMQRAVRDSNFRYAYAASCVPALCDARKFGTPEANEDALSYAYHMDAALLAAFLCNLCMKRGVKHVSAHVEGAALDERGFIRHVITREGRRLAADMFIDCTGFKGLLINDTLAEPFVSHAQYLINDRAVAFQAPRDPEEEGIRPYTTATALTAGWMWNIPLYHRDGCGYVYSSEFASPEVAERELRQRLGPASKNLEANHIRIRVGACRNLWVRNCLAIGLSGAFIEPLESTSIFLTEYQLAKLVSLFPDRSFSERQIRRYNEAVIDVFHQVRDFVAAHFCTTRRDDTPYWKSIRNDVPIPDSLQALLDDFQQGVLPDEAERLHIFRGNSITSVLTGMGVFPERASPILDHVDEAAADRHFARIREQTSRLLATLPDHAAYIRSLHD